jgi:hypothetical protein
VGLDDVQLLLGGAAFARLVRKDDGYCRCSPAFEKYGVVLLRVEFYHHDSDVLGFAISIDQTIFPRFVGSTFPAKIAQTFLNVAIRPDVANSVRLVSSPIHN